MDIHAEHASGFRRIAHGAQRKSVARMQQALMQDQKGYPDWPDQKIKAKWSIELKAEWRDHRDTANAQCAAGDPVPFQEQHLADDAQCKRSQRQKVSRK